MSVGTGQILENNKRPPAAEPANHQALSDLKLPQRLEEVVPAFFSDTANRLKSAPACEEMLAAIGKRGFLVDCRQSPDGEHVDLLTSSLRKKIFGSFAMPEWSERAGGMALGGYKRELSFVRLNPKDPTEYEVLGQVTIDAYKNFAAALLLNGGGLVLNVDLDTASRPIVNRYSADGRLNSSERTNQAFGSPGIGSGGTRITELEFDKNGQLWARLQAGYQDPKWERLEFCAPQK